jgi:hypothetical protein
MRLQYLFSLLLFVFCTPGSWAAEAEPVEKESTGLSLEDEASQPVGWGTIKREPRAFKKPAKSTEPAKPKEAVRKKEAARKKPAEQPAPKTVKEKKPQKPRKEVRQPSGGGGSDWVDSPWLWGGLVGGGFVFALASDGGSSGGGGTINTNLQAGAVMNPDGTLQIAGAWRVQSPPFTRTIVFRNNGTFTFQDGQPEGLSGSGSYHQNGDGISLGGTLSDGSPIQASGSVHNESSMTLNFGDGNEPLTRE